MDSYILILDDCNFNIQDPLMHYISIDRQEKIKRYHFDIDKKLSFYAELIIRMGLAASLSLSPKSFIIKVNKNKKPYLENFPNRFFNISHTRNALLCTISSIDEVGVDIEKIKSKFPEILQRIGHSDEIRFLNSQAQEVRNYNFYKIWTRKEAFGKRNGLGICQDLTLINTLVTDSASQYITWQEGSYICSVYCDKRESNTIHLLQENMIRHFYKHHFTTFKLVHTFPGTTVLQNQ